MIRNRVDCLDVLTSSQLQAGYIKCAYNNPRFKLPAVPGLYKGEFWAWIAPEQKKLHDDYMYCGKITAIFDSGSPADRKQLERGDEIVIRCNGNKLPTLDPEWVKENLSEKREILITKVCPWCHEKPIIGSRKIYPKIKRDPLQEEGHGDYPDHYEYYVGCKNVKCPVNPQTKSYNDIDMTEDECVKNAVKDWNNRE